MDASIGVHTAQFVAQRQYVALVDIIAGFSACILSEGVPIEQARVLADIFEKIEGLASNSRVRANLLLADLQKRKNTPYRHMNHENNGIQILEFTCKHIYSNSE